MTAAQELRTARLLLRSLQREDIPAIVQLAGAREISAMTALIPHPYSEQDGHEFLQRASEEFLAGRCVSFAICISPGTELCGAVGLNITAEDQCAELGYWIGVPYWGQGYATEAAAAVLAFGFETLQLNRIYAVRFAENKASGRVLEKIGLRHEGRSPQHIKKWERFVDLENYGLLRSDFREKGILK